MADPVHDGCVQADGTRLVLKNGFLEVVDFEPGLRRSKSESSIRSSCRSSCNGSLAPVDAAKDSAAGRPPTCADDGQVWSATASVHSHESFSEHHSVTSDSNSHYPPWGELDDGSQCKSSGYGFSDGSQYESSGFSSHASVSSHSESYNLRRVEESEDLEPQDAELLKANEAQHAAGTCKPCLYHRTKAGCANGRACMFCHQPHATKRRARPSKAERMHCKQLVAALDGQSDGVGLLDESNPSQYMLSILRARERQQGAPQAEPSAGSARAAPGERPRRRAS
ncbi:unnamed protein product [Prorocentrum cordatum]|uniref:C3H1-type domain-containing protein n=1 Tax=Prorocentrum cordatum TaxID=2364126 RepID=A0ABN9YHT0_9DINO|nr:unnamed protein product [Polarella glacialis]